MSQKDNLRLKGRGAQGSVSNRFNKQHYEADHELSDFSLEELEEGIKTEGSISLFFGNTQTASTAPTVFFASGKV